MLDPEYKIIITDGALLNLEQIIERIRMDSPESASRIAKALVEGMDSLQRMPLRFRVVGKSRKRKSDVHAMVIYPFALYFRCDPEAKSVHRLSILHGARRQPRRFK